MSPKSYLASTCVLTFILSRQVRLVYLLCTSKTGAHIPGSERKNPGCHIFSTVDPHPFSQVDKLYWSNHKQKEYLAGLLLSQALATCMHILTPFTWHVY